MTEINTKPPFQRSEAFLPAGLVLAFFSAVGLVGPGALHLDVVVFSIFIAVPLIWATVTDLRDFTIHDLSPLLLAVVGVASTLWFDPVGLIHHVAAAAVLATLLYLVRTIHEHYCGYSGLGLGDVKLMSAIAIVLGFGGALSTLLIASFAGVVTCLATGRRKLPFGVFLATSCWVVWHLGSIF